MNAALSSYKLGIQPTRIAVIPVALLLFILPAQSAFSAVDDIHVHQVPQSVLPNFTVNDVLLDFTGNLRGQQLILELTAGSIYQSASNPGVGRPSDALIDLFPEAEYDTYVTIGRRSDPPGGLQPILIVGGAVDLQPGSSLKFDTEGLNVAWAPGTGIDISEGQDFQTARITLSNDARGILSYFGSTGAGTGDPLIQQFDVCAGAIGISDCGSPPVVDDKSVEYTAMFPSTLVSENLSFSGASPFFEEWSLESFDSPNGKPAMVDLDTGLFTWDGYGSPEGVYQAVIRFTTDIGSDSGTLSIIWHVPEPASWMLTVWTAVAAVGCSRRRTHYFARAIVR
jgi:hypothetical protein